MTKNEPVNTKILDDERIDYRHDGKTHIAESGKVALSNWVGRVGSKRVRVYRGASFDKVPEPVRKAMAASGIHFGIITLEELGLRSLPAKRQRPILPEASQG